MDGILNENILDVAIVMWTKSLNQKQARQSSILNATSIGKVTSYNPYQKHGRACHLLVFYENITWNNNFLSYKRWYS